jgi:receptor expression-enhancing protein 5/6
MVPTKWNGSAKIYHSIIKPFVLKHQKKVDAALDKMADTAQNVLDEGTDIIGDAASQQFKDSLKDASKVE